MGKFLPHRVVPFVGKGIHLGPGHGRLERREAPLEGRRRRYPSPFSRS